MDKRCEICGHTVDIASGVVSQYPDRINRCKICADKACYGRFIWPNEFSAASLEQKAEWAKQKRHWMLELGDTYGTTY